MTIGVLAMQGAFVEHLNALKKLNIDTKIVRYASDFDSIDGIIIPGGESTVIGKLITDLGIKETLFNNIKNGLPVWGTCAGMIIIAKSIENSNVVHMPLMDVEVRRNAYGKQLGSFEKEIEIKEIPGGLFNAVFIRAPFITKILNDVNVLASVEGNIVAARQKNMLATSFHPELTDDTRIHQYFIEMVKERKKWLI